MGFLSCIAISATFIFVVLSQTTTNLHKFLASQGPKATKPQLVRIFQDLASQFERESLNSSEGKLHLYRNAVESLELMANETDAVEIREDGWIFVPPNRTLGHLIDELQGIYDILELGVGYLDLDDPLERSYIKSLYGLCEWNPVSAGKDFLMNGLMRSIVSVSAYIHNATGIKQELALYAKINLIGLRSRVDAIKVPGKGQSNEKQVVEMIDIINKFLGIYDIVLKGL